MFDQPSAAQLQASLCTGADDIEYVWMIYKAASGMYETDEGAGEHLNRMGSLDRRPWPLFNTRRDVGLGKTNRLWTTGRVRTGSDATTVGSMEPLKMWYCKY